MTSQRKAERTTAQNELQRSFQPRDFVNDPHARGIRIALIVLIVAMAAILTAHSLW
jgi:hypothetical protein